MDLTVLDQVGSVKVRVMEGVRILQHRVAATRLAGLLSQSKLLVCAGAAVGGLVATAIGTRDTPALGISLGAVLAAWLMFLLARLVRVRIDLGQMSRLAGRYRPVVEACEDLHLLVDLAQEILDEVRKVSGADAGADE